MINPQREIIEIKGIDQCFHEKKLLWYLRNYKNALGFIQGLVLFEKKLFMNNEKDRPLLVLSKVSELIDKGDIVKEYKFKKVFDETDVNLIKEYVNILMYIHNSLHPQKYLILVTNVKILFSTINQILFNYIL